MRLKRCPGARADRVLSRPRGDSRCHRSHPPPRGPLTTRRGPPPLTARVPAATAAAAQQASTRRPGCRWIYPRPLPAPRRPPHLFLRLLLLLLPQPPPLQPPVASLPLQQAQLFRIAPLPGAEGPPLRVKGRSRFRPRGAVRPGRAPVSHSVSAVPVTWVRDTLVNAGADGSYVQGKFKGSGLLAWSPASSPVLPTDGREGLRESCRGPSGASGSPPAASAGLTDRGGLGTVCQPRGRAGAPRAVHGVRPWRPLKTVGSDFRELQAVEESKGVSSQLKAAKQNMAVT